MKKRGVSKRRRVAGPTPGEVGIAWARAQAAAGARAAVPGEARAAVQARAAGMLSVTEANELAGDRARVSVDLEDPRLWRVWRAGGVQVHAPMTREAWLAFLATGEAGLGAVDVSAVGEQAEPPTAQALVQSADGTMRCGRCGLHADQCTCGAGSPVRQVCLATARAMAGGLASRGVKSAALEEAMREHFSPAAVAAVAALLTHPASRVRNAAVARELEWFAGHLVDMLGVDEFKALCTEAGL